MADSLIGPDARIALVGEQAQFATGRVPPAGMTLTAVTGTHAERATP